MRACNNGLGSKVEADLVDWYDDTVTLPASSGDAVQGARRATRIFYRADANGTPGLLMDESSNPGVRELLLSGDIDLTAYEPDQNRVRLALLKHAFLAACIAFGPPESAEADAVRADLIAARDAPDRHEVPRSDIALGLTVLRSKGTPRTNEPVLHSIATGADHGELHGVTLAGTFVLVELATWGRTSAAAAPGSGVVHARRPDPGRRPRRRPQVAPIRHVANVAKPALWDVPAGAGRLGALSWARDW